MKTKCIRTAACLSLVLLLLLLSVIGTGAQESEETTAPAVSENHARYTNPETSFCVMILDDDDLLTDAEEAALTEDMKPLTAFGNIAFWSTEAYASDEIEQARLKRKELFEFSSAGIFVINMNIRKLTIQTYGTIEQYIDASKARSITDNAKHYASTKDYYQAAKNAYEQMYLVIDGQMIPEPMKYASYTVLALMAGIIAALAFSFSRRSNPLIEETKQFKDEQQTVSVCQNASVKLTGKDKEWGRVPKILAGFFKIVIPLIRLGGGGGGCGSSGGSSGCGSSGCGGGGGGGGGCGSGGSSSF